MDSAPVSDVGRSPATRVVGIYDLTPQVFALGPDVPLADRTELDQLYEFGRVQRHIRAAARLLPRAAFHAAPRAAVGVAGGSLDVEIRHQQVVLLVTPRGDLLLVHEVELPGTAGAPEVARFLAATCYARERLTVGGTPILTWLSDRLGATAAPAPVLGFGGNVHQCVFGGGALGDELLNTTSDGLLAAGAITIINRGTRSGRSGIRTPRELNHAGETLVAHARGVSLVVGWSRPLQNVLALVATTTVSALGVLHRAREHAFDALELSQTTRLVSTGGARELVSQLSARLSEVQLDLSFGVEAYVDSVLIPELLVDSFQSSMRAAADLESGLRNTSRMVDRLAAVIRARAAVLEAATQDDAEQRNRLFNVLLAVGSLIALPPSLLLAFFGVASTDIDPSRSVLDLGHYWLAYGLAWLPFTALVLVGFLFRRRIRARSRLIDLGDHPATPDGGRVPAPRTGPEPEPAGHLSGTRG